jgi:hypothetical protein
MAERLNVTREVAALKRMTVKELRGRYAETFGEATRSGNKDWLWKRIIWRMQANAQGGLSERARRRAEELANEADLRVRLPVVAPPPPPPPGAVTTRETVQFGNRSGALMPGTVLTREYKGRTIAVTLMDRGVEFEGEVYRSLSAVAKAVTGSHWNGRYFFGLKGRSAG